MKLILLIYLESHSIGFVIFFNPVVGGVPSTEEALLLPTQQPRARIPSLWTALRLNPSSAKQWNIQIQLAVTSRAKYYKKSFEKIFLNPRYDVLKI